MGHGSYTASDWAKLRQSRGINSSSSVNQLFTQTQMDDRYNPRFIECRESCDSADSPESTPVILAFDDTGSMGYLAEEIAKNALNSTITQIYDKQPITNPHILCAAFGNHPDRAPLQVTQFEADIRVVEQLLDLWIERRGYGYSGDTFVWYFAAKHTKIDSIKKRGKKGFLFTMGDDMCLATLEASVIKNIFNDDTKDYTTQELIKEASKSYEIFHIVTKPLRADMSSQWESVLPGRVATVDAASIGHLSQVIISIMQLAGGKPRAEILEQWEPDVRTSVEKALSTIHHPNERVAWPTAPVIPETPKAKKKRWPF